MSFAAQISQTLGCGSISDVTQDRLERFAALVVKWNPAINIVARSTISELWKRHILDSVQVYCFTPESAKHWADLGSGGGFPGIIVAILAAEMRRPIRVTLVESDKRKCVFLTAAARLLELDLTVLAARIETLAPLHADVVSARALASLPQLCELASLHLSDKGVCIFPKGERAEAEVALARQAWHFDLESSQSITDDKASLLILKGLHRV